MNRLLVCAALTVVSAAGLASARAPEPKPAFEQSTPDAEVTLQLPRALDSYPELRADLLKTDVASLKRFLIEARKMKADAVRSGAPDQQFWREIEYEPAAVTARLVSLAKRESEYAGGAHPNHELVAVIWDKSLRRRIRFLSLFRPDADWARLDGALCRAVKAAKAKQQDATPIDGKLWTCPTWRKSAAVLAPSIVPGKAGGLVFLFSPYAIGPYVEGEWEIDVPLADFRQALAPAYAGEFAGRPK